MKIKEMDNFLLLNSPQTGFLKNRFYNTTIEELKNVTESSNLTNQLPQLLHLTALHYVQVICKVDDCNWK